MHPCLRFACPGICGFGVSSLVDQETTLQGSVHRLITPSWKSLTGRERSYLHIRSTAGRDDSIYTYQRRHCRARESDSIPGPNSVSAPDRTLWLRKAYYSAFYHSTCPKSNFGIVCCNVGTDIERRLVIFRISSPQRSGHWQAKHSMLVATSPKSSAKACRHCTVSISFVLRTPLISRYADSEST